MTIIEKQYNWNGNLSKRTKTDYIVLHHAAAVSCTADDIHRWHLNNGWVGMAYHFFVRKNGEVYRGRPIDTVGAHCEGYNSVSVGICAEGAYDDKDSMMPEAQKAEIRCLVAELKKVYKTAKVVRHKDLNATSCPGKYFPFEEIVKGEVDKQLTINNEQLTVEGAVEVLKAKVGLADETITFMLCYKYGEQIVLKLANAIEK